MLPCPRLLEKLTHWSTGRPSSSMQMPLSLQILVALPSFQLIRRSKEFTQRIACKELLHGNAYMIHKFGACAKRVWKVSQIYQIRGLSNTCHLFCFKWRCKSCFLYTKLSMNSRCFACPVDERCSHFRPNFTTSTCSVQYIWLTIGYFYSYLHISRLLYWFVNYSVWVLHVNFPSLPRDVSAMSKYRLNLTSDRKHASFIKCL